MPVVDAFLRSDPFTNVYAFWDLHYLRRRARFYVCMEDDRLAGLLLDYLGRTGYHSIWVWGGKEAAGKLLDDTPLPDRMVFHLPLELEEIIESRFTVTARHLVDFMV